MSINTENTSIQFKHFNAGDPEEAIEDEFDIAAVREKASKKKKTKDLQLNQVEELKDRLGKHAIELEKLFGKKRGMRVEED